MKLNTYMDAYRNGERPAVQGPLDYMQVQQLLGINKRLVDSLKEMIDAKALEVTKTPLSPEEMRLRHYRACTVVIDAEALL